jgi:hypothetical protein
LAGGEPYPPTRADRYARDKLLIIFRDNAALQCTDVADIIARFVVDPLEP